MKRFALSTLAGLVLCLSLSSANASVVPSSTASAASQSNLYGVFHDRQTDFVFVKLPQGWTFAGRDQLKGYHEVFLDASTGFAFVKLSGGWKFMGTATP